MKKFALFFVACSCIFAQTLKVGINAEYPPFEFISEETSQTIGFDVDLIKELSKRVGFDIEIIEEDYQAICEKINNQELDIGISSFGDDTYTQNCERSKSYFESSLLFVKLKGRNDINTKNDLTNKIVAYDEDIDSVADSLSDVNATLKTVDSKNIMSALFWLQEKNADAVVLDSINRGILIEGYPYLGTRDKQILKQSQEIGIPFVETEIFYEESVSDSETFIIFPKDGRLNYIKDKIDAEITKMREDGTIKTMLKKYEL